MILPSTLYQQALDAEHLVPDSEQQEVMTVLDQLARSLTPAKRHTLGQKLLSILTGRQKQQKKGLYLWGGVGIGKTMLMDLFLKSITCPSMRYHFHDFMHMIQHKLAQQHGLTNPIDHIVDELATHTKLICLDEFLVSDIGDAMILERLLKAFFEHDMMLVTTSNTRPKDLYKDGLQRERFLPAIQLISEHLYVKHIVTHHDYRNSPNNQHNFYFTPLNHHNAQQLDACFTLFAGTDPVSTDPLTICQRTVPTIKHTPNIAWFSFQQLCDPPRNKDDYLVLSQTYHTLCLDDVPKLNPADDAHIVNMIHLVDICYDTKTRLVIRANTAIPGLYMAGKYIKDFARTQSRLTEMQSSDFYQDKSV